MRVPIQTGNSATQAIHTHTHTHNPQNFKIAIKDKARAANYRCRVLFMAAYYALGM